MSQSPPTASTDFDDDSAGASLLSGWRWPAALLGITSVVAHLPVIPEHVREAPYMGALFGVYCLAALALVALLLLADTLTRYVLLALVSATAVLTYVATRLVAFPQLAGDVGSWGDPFGLLAITAEAGTAAACALALARSRRLGSPAAPGGP